jgi:hypothetical protein
LFHLIDGGTPGRDIAVNAGSELDDDHQAYHGYK